MLRLRQVCGIFLAGLALPAAAHHAFIAQYDSDKPATLDGIVVKIDWLNPHAYFYIDVADDSDGAVATWAVEMGSPVVLMRQGWTRNSMKIGDQVTVDGLLARDGSTSLNARSVMLSTSGKRLFTRSAQEEAEAQSGSTSGN